MVEAHSSTYSIIPRYIKMYRDLQNLYWWLGMKKDISEYVNKCLTYQQVKLEHQLPSGLTQQLSLPKWKWDLIIMDSVVGLPKNPTRYDSI